MAPLNNITVVIVLTYIHGLLTTRHLIYKLINQLSNYSKGYIRRSTFTLLIL
jgi:hypothetical protein